MTESAPDSEDGKRAFAPNIAYLLDTLTEERQLVASAILARNRESAQLKQWCLMLWLASWGVISFPHVWNSIDPLLIAGAPIMFPVFFFLMELINKRNERKFTYRARQIHSFLNGADDQPGSYGFFVNTGVLGDFRIYDPAGANWLHSGVEDEDKAVFQGWIGWRSVLIKSWGLAVFYLALILVTTVCSVLLYFRQ